ncbi:MAG: adenosine deaminase [Coprobacillus sp.]|nr:adenosine deaminase [Coprobacillus sp.]
MIDLHLHLDGSLSLDEIMHLCEMNKVEPPKSLESALRVSSDCKSLEEYLTKFDFPLTLLQNEESLVYAFYSLVKRLYKRGYIYIEIRFAPLLHTKGGMSIDEVVEAAIKGCRQALSETVNFDVNLILCCMRNASKEENIETVRAADRHRDSIAAVDLAGPEALHPASYFQEVFDLAHDLNLNITVHAGEATGSNEVMDAIKLLHAKRIGHGVHLELTKENLDVVHFNNIGFEFCPTSNVQTTSLPSYSACPIKEFLQNNILVTINCDNITVSNTHVFDEFEHLMKEVGLDKGEIYQLLFNAITISYTDENEKKWLKGILDDRFEDYYHLLDVYRL